MALFDPIENAARITSGLAELVRSGVAEFGVRRRSLIVVFEGEPDVFQAGRIQLFQQFIYSNIGLALEITKQVSGCIKVYFRTDELTDDEREQIKILLSSPIFGSVSGSLDIAYAQFGDSIYYPSSQNL